MPVVDCMISSPTKKLGTWVYVRGKNTGKTLYCRVTDVSAPKDKARHIRNGLVAELDYDSTSIICGSTKLRNDECPVTVTEVK